MALLELLVSELLLRTLKLGDGLAAEGDGLLGVSLVEELTGPVSAGALGDAELVALEVSRVLKGLLGRDGLGLLGGAPLGEDLLLGKGGGDLLGASATGDGDGELEGLNVLHVLNVGPDGLVLGVLNQDAVGVDDVLDHGNLVGAGSTEDADEATGLDVVLAYHFFS